MKDKLHEVATLAESSVQAIARGEVDQVPTPRRKGAQKPVPAIDTHSVKVLPAVWEKAQEILSSGHGYTRIEILDANSVVVR